jgi:hypothetical protein
MLLPTGSATGFHVYNMSVDITMTFSRYTNVCAEIYQYINVSITTVGRRLTDRIEPGVNICDEVILVN